jgi:hypothetical protein
MQGMADESEGYVCLRNLPNEIGSHLLALRRLASDCGVDDIVNKVRMQSLQMPLAHPEAGAWPPETRTGRI